MDVLDSARTHGISDDDIVVAATEFLIAYPLDDGDELAIHAMKCRPRYFDLLL